ncbi:S1 family peptidase [Streptomyces polychromogenes]|uniref:S1 family peptidase n=1 Tax=Streptomyces polychromogenes TaxID=67342 RepID=UPI003CD09624
MSREADAVRIAAELEKKLGVRFAGAWVSGPLSRLTVATTSSLDAQTIEAAGAEAKVVVRGLDLSPRPWPRSTRPLVTVRTTKDRPRALYDVRGGDAYYIDEGARCSVGFSVTKDAQGGFATAGHCGKPGATTTGFNKVAQGTFRSGSTTGWHCGTVEEHGTSVDYGEGTVSGVTRSTVCSEPGDSGGSFLSGDQAQGVASGGSGNCTEGGVSFHQPINPLLKAYGLTLTTSPSKGDG